MRRALAVLTLAVTATGCAAAPVVQRAAAPAPPARDEMVVLLPGPDGTVGALTIEHEGQQRTLDAAYATTRLQRQGQLEDAGRVAPEQVRQTFEGALGARPPRPVTFVL